MAVVNFWNLKDQEQEEYAKSCLNPASHFTLTSFRRPEGHAFAQTFETYQSGRSGIKIVLIKQDLPLVYGHFVIPTTAADDDGIPHTLEHLVFMGSEKYPQASLLAKVANRAYSFTNAYTEVDHTCYEITSAGWPGLATVLPIYLDHLFFPLLTDDACYTEVHHLDPNGIDAGVVYAEMQARENQKDDVAELHIKRTLYPELNPYRYETGGLTPNIRSLTAQRIREYHRATYRPASFTLIFEGDIDCAALFKLLDAWEDDLATDHPDLLLSSKERLLVPLFLTKATGLEIPSFTTVAKFGDSEESAGEIQLVYKCPSHDEFPARFLFEIVLDYLLGDTTGVLTKAIVEEAHLSSALSGDITWRSESILTIFFTDVLTGDMEKTTRRWSSLIRETCGKPIDMNRMATCVQQYIASYCSQRELAIGHHEDVLANALYQSEAENITTRCFNMKSLIGIQNASNAEWWATIIRRWFVDASYLTVFIKPNSKLLNDMEATERDRLMHQQRTLTEEQSRKLIDRLAQARSRNEEPPARRLGRPLSRT